MAVPAALPTSCRTARIELSLRAQAHEQLDADAQHVLALLRRPGTPAVGDGSSPEQLRDLFGLSKKAFKRAVARLLKDGAIEITPQGYAKPRERSLKA